MTKILLGNVKAPKATPDRKASRECKDRRALPAPLARPGPPERKERPANAARPGCLP